MVAAGSFYLLQGQAPCRHALGGSTVRVQPRCVGRRGLAVRAAVAEVASPPNPVGIHAQVWVGDWSKQAAEYAISGSKKAGYDLIEREFWLSSALAQARRHI